MHLAVDHAFHIGDQHLRQGKPNQDYALSGTMPDGLHFGIVADGCSNGGHTDIGARLTALAFKQALTGGAMDSLIDRAQVHLDTMRRALQLETNDMLATGLLAVANNSGHVSAVILGDGVMVEQSTSGVLTAHRYSWSDNAPYYLAYATAHQAEFLSREPTLTHERWTIHGPDNWQRTHTITESAFLAVRRGITWSYEPPHGPWNLLAVGIFSDGVEHITDVPWQQVVWELMAFKSPRGQFVTRRMNRFLTDMKSCGHSPLDDISMAVITLQPQSP